MGGAAPVVDGSGHIWVSTGNGSVYSDTHAYDDSDSVLELSPSLQLDAVLRAEHVGHEQLPGPGHVRSRRCCCPTARCCWPGSPGSSTCSTARTWAASATSRPPCGLGLRRRHRRRRRGGGHDGLPALPGGHHRGPGHQFPARAAPAVEFRGGRRAAHRGGGPGLDHRAERRAVRARPGDREGAAAGHDRRAGQSFPDPERRRRPPARRLRGQRGRLRRAGPRRCRPRPRVRHSILAARPTPRRPRPRRLRTFASATSPRPPSARPW